MNGFSPRRAALAAVIALLAPAGRIGAQTVGFVYVNAEGSVAGYAVDGTGVLTPVPGSPVPTVPASSNCDVMTAVYDDTRHVLYVSNPQFTGAGPVSAFAVDLGTGALTPVPGSPFATTSGTADGLPAGLAFDAVHAYLYAGKGYQFGFGNGVDGFAIAGNGALTLLAGSPFGVGGSDSGFTMATDALDNTIITSDNDTDLTVFDVLGGGTLSPAAGTAYPLRGDNIHALAVNPVRQELAVASNGMGEVVGYQLLAGGAISGPGPTTTVATGFGAAGLAFTPDGNRLYAANWSTELYGFAASAGPVFTPAGWSPFPIGFMAVNTAVSADGNFLFVTGYGDLASYALNPVTGAPTLVWSVSFTAGGCGAGLAYVPAGGGQLRKSVAPAGPVCAGAALAYRIGWTNAGAMTMSTVTITDTLPVGVAYQAPSLAVWAQPDWLGTPVVTPSWATAAAGPWTGGEPPNGAVAPLLLRWIVDRVAPGRSGSLMFAVSLSGTLSAGATVTNRAAAARAGSTTVYVSEAVSTLVLAPAQLTSRLTVSPAPALVGQWVSVMLTVTNAGQVNATGVVAALQLNAGAAALGPVTGPAPAGPLVLAPGAAQTFVWTCSGSAAGVARLTATAFGTDACAGVAIGGAGLSASVAVTSLGAALAVSPNPATPGQTVTVTLTLTNSGGGDVTGVLPAIQINAGAGFVTLLAGPAPPGPVTIPAGGTVMFVWTYSAVGGGLVAFTATGTGTDVPTGLVVTGVATAVLGIGGDVPCPGPWGAMGTVAGDGSWGYNADGIPATTAWLASPTGVATDAAGNVYIADGSNNRIRKVTAATGLISTVAGTGPSGYNGDGIAATAAWLSGPQGVAVDSVGNLYIADTGNARVRRVDAGTGLISTVAGTGSFGYNGDGIPATTANLGSPAGVAVDVAGNVYVADQWDNRVRKVTVATGLISTVAGTGLFGYNGDGIPATGAQLSWPMGVDVDPAGNLYVADASNNRIRKVAAATGLISTVAGTGSYGYNGDGIAATAAWLADPAAVAVDGAGHLYIADQSNQRVRRVDAATGLIATVAGTGVSGFNGDGLPATAAQLSWPYAVALDASCRLYIADAGNERIRRVDPAGPGFLAVSVQKTQTPAAPAIGAAVTYRITIANTGQATITALSVVDTLSPVIVAAATDQPAAFGAPVVTSVAGGTRYVWSATGLAVPPGQALTITVTGAAGFVCGTVRVSNTAWVAAMDGTTMVTGQAAAAGFTLTSVVAGIPATKIQIPALPVAGGPLTWMIVVRNTGSMTITALTVTDTVSAVATGVTTAQPAAFAAPVVTSVAGGTRYAWSAGALAFGPGQTYTFTVTGTVGTVGVATSVSNTAYVVAVIPCGILYTSTNPVGFRLAGPPPPPAIAVSKAALPAAPAAGGTVRYLMTIRNAGAATITALTLTDTVSPVLTTVTAAQPAAFGAPAAASVAGGTRYAWSAGGLFFTPGQIFTFTLTGAVGMVCAPGTVTNLAFAAATAGTGTATAFTGAVSFPVSPPALGVAAVLTQAPATQVPGGPVVFRLVVTNAGAATVTGLTVTDTLASAVGGGAADQPGPFGPPAVADVTGGTRYVWSAAAPGLLPPGASFTFTLTGTAAGPVGTVTSATMLVEATAACGATTVASNRTTLTIVGVAPSLAAGASLTPYPVRQGDTFLLVLTVTNTGAVPVGGLLPFVTLAGPGDAVVTAGPAPAGPVALAPGASASFTWTLRALHPGPLTLTARADGTASGTPITASAALVQQVTPRFKEAIVVYPNPATGDALRVAFGFGRDAALIEVNLFDMGLERVYHGEWADVRASVAEVEVRGLSGLAPGLYLLRARATFADGTVEAYPAVKVVLRR